MEAVKKSSSAMIWLAFATVYLVWGSTYFFIQKAIEDIPPFLLGALRFLAAGLLMLGWCLWKGEPLWNAKMIRVSLVTGFLLLFIGNGAVIWAEMTIPSSLAAIIVSSAPIWFVMLDYPKWKENLSNRKIISGLLIGFMGVVLLFSNQIKDLFSSGKASPEILGLAIVLVGCISWAGGSLYSKYKGTGSALANTTWQMFTGGVVFLIMSLLNGESKGFNYTSVGNGAWLSLLYLIFFGSLAAYSAYVWLLSVRPATQVSTYAYVNPVVAVLLGVLFANEKLGLFQLFGLCIILLSVLLINQSKK